MKLPLCFLKVKNITCATSLILLCLAFSFHVEAQDLMVADSIVMSDADDFQADDYGNFYVYRNRAFSLTKYDSLGQKMSEVMLALPYRLKSVKNPLNIVLYSANAQSLKLMDQHLNEIQKIDWRGKFGFVRMAFVAGPQNIWLVDQSSKSLIQYNYRTEKVLSTYAFNIEYEGLKDFLVYNNQLYWLTEKGFQVYNFQGELLYEQPISDGHRLQRENDTVFIIGKQSIQKFNGQNVYTAFKSEDAQIVDKNSSAYFELKGNKLYLYRIGKS